MHEERVERGVLAVTEHAHAIDSTGPAAARARHRRLAQGSGVADQEFEGQVQPVGVGQVAAAGRPQAGQGRGAARFVRVRPGRVQRGWGGFGEGGVAPLGGLLGAGRVGGGGSAGCAVGGGGGGPGGAILAGRHFGIAWKFGEPGVSLRMSGGLAGCLAQALRLKNLLIHIRTQWYKKTPPSWSTSLYPKPQKLDLPELPDADAHEAAQVPL